MTAKQKANRERFKKVVAEAKKLRQKNPKMTQAQAVKQAWAIMYSKKRAGVGAAKKSSSYHKDTKSHNVNIRVVSGIKINRKPGKIGALPIDFNGSVLGLKFRVYNQFNLDGTVTLQIVENIPNGELIYALEGRKDDVQAATNVFWGSIDWSAKKGLSIKDTKKVKKTINDFIKNLDKELREYNSGKDKRTKKGAKITVKATPKVSKGPKDQIKDILRSEKKRLKYGYTIVPGKVMSGMGSAIDDLNYLLREKKKAIENFEVAKANRNRKGDTKEVKEHYNYWYNRLKDYIKGLDKRIAIAKKHIK